MFAQRSIGANTQLYGIIGSPVRHSLSPAMHNAAFNALGMDAVYLAFETRDADSALDAMRCLGIKGYSVTIPNKQDVVKFLDEVEESVSSIGACNTVKNEDGLLVGTNTDWLGGIMPLEKRMDLKGVHAVVLGAGGSAMAICFGLLQKGAKVSVCNRTKERAVELADRFGCDAYSLDEAVRLSGEILINATSVGMAPHSEDSPVGEDVIDKFNLVMDIVYSPLETRLLKSARGLGKQVVTGIEMLLFQAVAQFEFWTGEKAPIDVMREALEKNINDR